MNAPGNIFRSTVRVLRIHQWAKNILVFVPFLTAHRFLDPAALFQEVLAFFSFCLCASGAYILNDLLDINDDRRHHTKRFRPFASGDLRPAVGFLLIPFLLGASAALSFLLPFYFQLTLAGYFVMTSAYSLWIKKRMFEDVLLLAALYTGRIIAGTVAIAAPYSPWLFAFSMFIFLSLALAKRHKELEGLQKRNGERSEIRGYISGDLEPIGQFGVVSGYLSILVMALYINSREVTILYKQPRMLWAVCLLLLFWVSRFWMLTYRGRVDEDPVVFALKDRTSYLVGVLTIGVILIAM